jgi:hypothetical protein
MSKTTEIIIHIIIFDLVFSIDGMKGVGAEVGAEVGVKVGAEVGVKVGVKVGAEVGVKVGAEVGAEVGAGIGVKVGAGVFIPVSILGLVKYMIDIVATIIRIKLVITHFNVDDGNIY